MLDGVGDRPEIVVVAVDAGDSGRA